MEIDEILEKKKEEINPPSPNNGNIHSIASITDRCAPSFVYDENAKVRFKDSSATDRSNEFNGHSPPPLRPLSTRRAACSIRSNDRERGRGWRGRKESNFSPSNRGEVYIEPGSKMRNCLSITRYSGGRGKGYHRRRGKINESDILQLQFTRQLINICIRSSVDRCPATLLAEWKICSRYFRPDSRRMLAIVRLLACTCFSKKKEISEKSVAIRSNIPNVISRGRKRKENSLHIMDRLTSLFFGETFSGRWLLQVRGSGEREYQ